MAWTDFILIELEAAPELRKKCRQALQRLCEQSPLGLSLERLAGQAQGTLCYAYLRMQVPAEVPAQALEFLQDAWRQDGGVPWLRVCRLELVFEAAGHSQAQWPAHHYVVETDPETGWDEEIFRWYDEEHMPGLARVPGCTLAQRLISHDAGPRSHACYGLLTEDTLACPPWLAVRHTAWSSRCRPHFTNTRRTMFDLVDA